MGHRHEFSQHSDRVSRRFPDHCDCIATGSRHGGRTACSSGEKLDPEASDYWTKYLCTNQLETVRVDLPPRFVSLMEGCGFSWGGHWGGPDSSTEAEGRQLGCDPMHFELP